jgi:hypothetical protein
MSSPLQAENFRRALRPYVGAFVERGRERRLALLAEALHPDAEIRGPSRASTGA